MDMRNWNRDVFVWRLPTFLAAYAMLASGCSLALEFDECEVSADCDTRAVCEAGICKARSQVQVIDDLDEDTTWSGDEVYRLRDAITVLPAVTLTIEPGALIVAEDQSGLIVRNGAELIARGTREEPIVFTSAGPVGQRRAGDWGGIAMMGKAPVNNDEASLDIAPNTTEMRYGGTDTAWNCGALEYVRIEFGGGRINGDKRVESLAMAGCGSETRVRNVQSHLGDGNGIAIHGGTVSPRRVVITRSQGHSLAIDQGWQGDIQYLAVKQGPNGTNAIDLSTQAADPSATPRTNGEIYNFTLIGAPQASGQRGVVFRDGAAGAFSHGIMTLQTLEAVDVVGTESGSEALEGRISIDDTLFYWIGENGDHFFPEAGEPGETGEAGGATDDGGFDEREAFMAGSMNNIFGEDPQIDDSESLRSPDWRPTAESVTEQALEPPPTPFDDSAAFRGAVDPNGGDWVEGWTDFPQR